ncbi:MAG: hypothetical protein V1668_02305 [Patescibacteria group bacterium]
MRFRLTIILFYLTAVFWVIFAASWLFRDSDYRYFYAVTGLGYAVVLAILAFYLNKKKRAAWWLAVVFAVLNILLTIADQVGWFDLAYLVPAIALLIMLFLIKPSVFGSKPANN